MVVLICRELTGGIRKHLVSILDGYKTCPEKILLVTNLNDADNSFQKYLENAPQFQSRILDLPIRRSPHPLDLLHMHQIFWGHRKALRRAVFHGHGAKGGLYARIIGKLSGGKTLYTPHGGSIHKMHGKINNFIYTFIEKCLYFLSDLIIFESRYSMQSYAQAVCYNSEKYVLNYNGVDFACDLKKDEEKILAHAKPTVLGAFGALRDVKGYDILIQAAAQLHREGLPVEVKIYGEGPEHDNLTKLASTLGIAEHCQIGQTTTDVVAAMRECDIVVQPSRFESFGYSTLEAISAMVPVITSNSGGLIEIVENKVTGMTFESDNSQALAAAIKFMIQNPEARLEMAQIAYRRSFEMFREDTMVQRLKEQYLV